MVDTGNLFYNKIISEALNIIVTIDPESYPIPNIIFQS